MCGIETEKHEDRKGNCVSDGQSNQFWSQVDRKTKAHDNDSNENKENLWMPCEVNGTQIRLPFAFRANKRKILPEQILF